MDTQNRIDPKHTGVRRFLRIAGPLALVAGLGLTIAGIATMILGAARFDAPGFDAFGSISTTALLMFTGLPLTFIGGVMCMAGFMGAVARYQLQEMAPPAVDTFNYVAEETQPGLQQVASAVGAGLAAGLKGVAAPQAACPTCGQANEADAQFCKHCGAAIGGKPCPACKGTNPADARFCIHCGVTVATDQPQP
jgi:hypothetical protein